MEKVEILVAGIISLIVGGILRNTLIKEAINQIFAVDTSNWPQHIVQFWNVFPIFLIAFSVFIPILAILSTLNN